MEKLSFSTGKKEFMLNGGQVISFIPTDPHLMGRICSALESLDKKQNAYRQTGNELTDAMSFFSFVDNMDAEMQETIDGIFGVHIDRAAFDGGSLFSVADGLPLWANFIFAVMDVMDIHVVEAQRAQNPRIQKIMAKYKRN